MIDRTTQDIYGRILKLEREMERRRVETEGKPWYIDVRRFGAKAGSTHIADLDYDPAMTTAQYAANRTAIQAAVDYGIAAGAAFLMLPERYHISGGPITVDTHPTFSSITLAGIGRQRSGLIQETSTEDILVYGRTADTSSADTCGARDMMLTGGKIGLRLNNAIEGHWHRLLLQNNQIGLQTEGQCEDHDFYDLHFTGTSSYGMYLGALNGAGVADELQKTRFFKTRMHGLFSNATNGIKLTAGIGISGQIEFDQLVLEDGPAKWIDVRNCGSVTFRRMRIEESAIALTDTFYRGTIPSGGWTAITQGSGCQKLILADCPILAPVDNWGNPWKYVLDQQSGYTTIQNCDFLDVHGSIAGTAAINIQDGGLLMIGGAVGNDSQIAFSGTSLSHSRVISVQNSATGGMVVTPAASTRLAYDFTAATDFWSAGTVNATTWTLFAGPFTFSKVRHDSTLEIVVRCSCYINAAVNVEVQTKLVVTDPASVVAAYRLGQGGTGATAIADPFAGAGPVMIGGAVGSYSAQVEMYSTFALTTSVYCRCASQPNLEGFSIQVVEHGA